MRLILILPPFHDLLGNSSVLIILDFRGQLALDPIDPKLCQSSDTDLLMLLTEYECLPRLIVDHVLVHLVPLLDEPLINGTPHIKTGRTVLVVTLHARPSLSFLLFALAETAV